jgi:DNA-binding NarL/FixJ family response regulator
MTHSTSTPRVRIVIADSHPIFRDGLRRLLETDVRLQIVGENAGGSAAVALVRDTAADILLLGLAATSREPIALPDFAAEGLSVRTIILTDRVDIPDVMRALQLGAWGVIPKDSSPDMLFSSIHSVMAGRRWMGDETSETVVRLRKLDAARRRSSAFGLTRRELEIVRAVVSGWTNKEIAERSSISENTVKSHLAHIFDKLGASNRVELALFASHHRIADGV